MPLRISRQMLLDQWNKAIAFVSSTMDARLADGKADAGAMLLQYLAYCRSCPIVGPCQSLLQLCILLV